MISVGTLVFLLLALSTASSRRVTFFRKDYTHFKELNAFYKLHFNGDSGTDWTKAFQVCNEESAQLFYPKISEEWNMVYNVTSNLVGLNDTEISLLVGIHDEFSIGEFVTVDGTSSPFSITGLDFYNAEYDPEKRCVVMDLGSEDLATRVLKTDFCVTELNRPFICRKTDELEPCPTIDKGYIYERAMNRCYKFNSRPKTWHEAFKTCYMEGAMLLVYDDLEEFRLIQEKLTKREDQTYFIGIHRIAENGDLYTVNGQRLDDGVYQIWYDKSRDAREDCGVIGSSYFKTILCDVSAPFICEMEAFSREI